jgi:uncharacterized protein (DUF3084 family)
MFLSGLIKNYKTIMATYNQEIPNKQKLRIADAYIKQLKGEIGMLESEKDELAYELEEVRKELGRVMVDIMNTKLTNGEKNMIKKELFGEQQKQERVNMLKKIKSLKKDKEILISKLLAKDKDNA